MPINNIIISGNLGKDAEVRESRDGKLFTRFSIAFEERKKDRKGEWVDETGWIGAVIFGERGEKLADTLKKGTPVTVSGKLSYSTYVGSDDVKRTSYEIRVDEIVIGAKKAKRQSTRREPDLADEDYEI